MAATAAILIQQSYVVVDLDGTLVLADTFHVSLLEAIRRRPSNLWLAAAGLFRGKAFCKQRVAEQANLNASHLPYNEPLIEFLRLRRAAGSRLILATGADLSIAEGVARHLGLFDDVISSNGRCNMTGANKLAALREKIGDAPFVYAGNSRTDLKLWRHSAGAILVDAPKSCMRELQTRGIPIEHSFHGPPLAWRNLVRCLRVHQWAKNTLVFVPAVLAHQLTNLHVLYQSLLAFLAVSFCASALYVVNDLLDLQADRQHPRKRRRPLAAGEVSAQGGVLLCGGLLLVSALICTFLPEQAILALLVYAAGSLTYSLKLKRVLFMDVICLALLYVIRVILGGTATEIKISIWTLAFSLFLFASLATVKRLGELRRIDLNSSQVEEYRGYRPADSTQLGSLCAASGYVAVMVLALYISSPEVTLLYKHPQGLWCVCPILIYWLSRTGILANRGELHDDPVAFALTDRATWVAGALCGVILILST